MWIWFFTPILNIFLSKEEVYLPDVIGLDRDVAVSILKDAGLNVKIKYIDYDDNAKVFSVFNLHPRPYSKVNTNRLVDLIVYNNKKEIITSNYTGLTIKEAKKQIKLDRLIIDPIDVFYYYDESDPLDVVSKQYPDIGEKIEEGSNVSLWVCSGKPPNEYVVPEVIGLTLNEAIKKIKANGFLIGDISYIIKNDLLESTVYEISYFSSNGYNIEVLEDTKYTVPMRLNITVTKYGE